MSFRDFVARLISRFKPAPPEHVHDEIDDSAPGWEAIDAALKPLYGEQEPHHWGTLIKWMLGGRDPLDGISVYRAEGPPLHWHYVSYGMSELYAKECDDPSVSGWGFEFTLRLKRDAQDAQPPIWAANLLQNLGRYVFDSGNEFDAGHSLDCNGPIALEKQTDIVAILFVRDPELAPIETPHGRLQFLQVVGITAEELEACRLWNTEAFADVLQNANPLLVTDLARASILGNETIARTIREGQERDGSTSSGMLVSRLGWSKSDEGWRVDLGALGAASLRGYVRGRTLHGREFNIVADERIVRLLPGNSDSVEERAGTLVATVTTETARTIAESVEARSGAYRIESLNLTFVVEPTVVRDGKGEVVRVVG